MTPPKNKIGLAASNSAAGGVTQASARLGCKLLNRLLKKDELKPRKKKLLKRAMCNSTSTTNEDEPKVEQEKVESKSPKKNQQETVMPNLKPQELEKKEVNIKSNSPTSPGEEKFQFSCQDKKAKELTVQKKKTKSKSKTVKAGAKAMRDEDSPPVASGSGVFDHEDDPYVKEIIRRQKKEAKNLYKRSKVESNGSRRQSVAMVKMAKYQISQSQGDKKDAFKKPKQAKQDKMKLSHKVEKTGSVSDGFSPDIDDLLKVPQRPDDGGKTKEEILDELDVKIRKMQKKHDEDKVKADEEIEWERKKREQWKTRLRENALLRNRLEKELSETKMRSTVQANLSYLQSIHDGLTPSARHEAFHKSVRTREALHYSMITDPFTDNQLNWTLEEMSKVWMKTKRERMDKNEYVWKVLLPECFIKVYGDKFGVSRAEAEVMIGETPLHRRDAPRMENDSTGGETEEEENTKE